MNYTENYHLPQWVKDDRIMMEDFNQMCADIEVGLRMNAQSASEAKNENGELGDKTFGQLCRMAHNHLLTLWDMSAFPRQEGLFREKMQKTMPWYNMVKQTENFLPVGCWKTAPDQDSFYQTMEQVSALHTLQSDYKQATPLIVNFTPKGGGTFPCLTIKGRYSTGTIQTTVSVPYRLTCTNLTTGMIEFQANRSFSFPGQSAAPTLSLPMDVLFHSGYNYQIELSATGGLVDCDFSIEQTGDFRPVFFTDSTASFSHIFGNAEDGAGGMFLVCCGSHGAGGAISLKLNGEELPVYQTRTYTGSRKDQVQEQIYRKPEHIPGGSVLQLEVSANPDGDLALYGWGGVLL